MPGRISFQVVESTSEEDGFKPSNIIDIGPQVHRLSKKTEQNAGFSAQIHRVSLTKTWFLKTDILSLLYNNCSATM